MSRIWCITGAGRGMGREIASAVLARGDRVAATARNIDQLHDLVERYGASILPLRLDVSDRDSVERPVHAARDHFGGLDILVNNAGYGLFGMVEELSERQLRDQMEVNFFSVFKLTKAVLPIMRQQGSGHIIQITSGAGLVSFPSLGGYSASKWAVEGLTDAMAQEVAGFGIKVTLVEPGPYDTEWKKSSGDNAEPMPEYDALRASMAPEAPENIGDPKAVGPALLEIAYCSNPPLRILFGRTALRVVPDVYERRLKSWREWEPVSIAAHGF